MEEFKIKLEALLTEYNMNLVPFMNIQIQEGPKKEFTDVVIKEAETEDTEATTS